MSNPFGDAGFVASDHVGDTASSAEEHAFLALATSSPTCSAVDWDVETMQELALWKEHKHAVRQPPIASRVSSF